MKGSLIPGTGSFEMASVERDHYASYVNKRKREYLDAVAMDLAIARHPHKEPVRVVRPVELKGVDIHMDERIAHLTQHTSSVGVQLLNGITEGTGSFQRVGRNVWMESVRVRGYVIFNFEPLYTELPVLRFVIVYDRTPSGLQPKFQDVFQITDATGTDSTPTLFSPVALEHTKRFRVLSDWTMECPPPYMAGPLPGGITVLSVRVPFDKYIPLKNLESQYSNTQADITAISTGGLYLYSVTTNNRVNGSPPPNYHVDQELNCIVRLRYRD